MQSTMPSASSDHLLPPLVFVHGFKGSALTDPQGNQRWKGLVGRKWGYTLNCRRVKKLIPRHTVSSEIAPRQTEQPNSLICTGGKLWGN